MKRFIFGLIIGWVLGYTSSSSHACGVDSDCAIGDRTYRISMPADHDGTPIGALMYAHGYRGSAKAAMKNKALRALAHELGLALVATKSASIDWMIPGVPADPSASGDVEYDYYDAVIADLEERFNVNPKRLIATGFSAGGMMVWNLACFRGDRFAAFIPVAGTYWDPVPETCPSGSVNLVHVHGTSDKIVPLAGRAIQKTRQGDVLIAIDRMVAAGDYDHQIEELEEGELSCKSGVNPDGKVFGFCTHSGGHSIKMDYLRTAWRVLQERGAF